MLRRNPTISVNGIDDDVAQIRFAGGNHITFELYGNKIADLLGAFEFIEKEELTERLVDAGIDREYAEELISVFEQSSIYVDDCDADFSDRQHALFYHESRVIGPAREHLQDNPIKAVHVEGTGELAEQAALVCESLGKKSDASQPDMVIVAHDRDDMPALQAGWQNSPGAYFKIAIWFDGLCLKIGPLSVRDESSCLMCMKARLRATSHFHAETSAFIARGSRSFDHLAIGNGVASLAQFALHRIVLGIDFALFNVVKPGWMESWDGYTGEVVREHIAKSPYCEFCGGLERPRRAVRNLI